ncbi:MFS transporter [Chryseobacterium sp. 1B4]
MGAILAPLLVPFILGHYGWRQTFVWIGALGMVWIILWWKFYAVPEKAKNLSKEELQYIKSDQAEKTEEKPKFLYRNYSNIKSHGHLPSVKC